MYANRKLVEQIIRVDIWPVIEGDRNVTSLLAVIDTDTANKNIPKLGARY